MSLPFPPRDRARSRPLAPVGVLGPRAAGRRRGRAGFTMLEIVIVVAIFSILTAIGYVFARDLVPQYRTRGAAMDFVSWVNHCRTTAITTGRQCRILLVEYDDDLDNMHTNTGKYLVQVAIPSDISSSSSAVPSATTIGWDTLPLDTVTDTSDDNASTGTIDLSTGDTRQRRVALAAWPALGGPGIDNDNAIVFDTRGFVANPSSDFTDGKIRITFVNKVAEERDVPDRWEVQITRAGLAQLNSSRRGNDDNFTQGGGTAASTSYDSDGVFDPP